MPGRCFSSGDIFKNSKSFYISDVTRVVVQGRAFVLPYMVSKYCPNFDSYWDSWCEQHGLLVSFKDLDIVDGQHLEAIVSKLFNKYRHVLWDQFKII